MTKELSRGPAMICEGGPKHDFAYYDEDWAKFQHCEAYDGRPVPYRKTDRITELPGSRHQATLTVWEWTE